MWHCAQKYKNDFELMFDSHDLRNIRKKRIRWVHSFSTNRGLMFWENSANDHYPIISVNTENPGKGTSHPEGVTIAEGMNRAANISNVCGHVFELHDHPVVIVHVRADLYCRSVSNKDGQNIS